MLTRKLVESYKAFFQIIGGWTKILHPLYPDPYIVYSISFILDPVPYILGILNPLPYIQNYTYNRPVLGIRYHEPIPIVSLTLYH